MSSRDRAPDRRTMMPRDPLDDLDPAMRQLVISVVFTVKWSKKPFDVWIGDNRLHAYPIKRFQGRICWSLVKSDLSECLACGVL